MDLELLISLLSQMGGNFNPSLMASALPANNVSPANISSAMNPNVLLSSGLVDPSTIQSGIESTYQQLLAEWESRNNAKLPPEASDLWLSPVTSKYSTKLGGGVGNGFSNNTPPVANNPVIIILFPN